jgi:sulfate adenylyltransferase
MMQAHLVSPHGGELVSLLVGPERRRELQAAARDWLSWDLTQRQLCDLESLLSGAFTPLAGFLTRQDYDSVCANNRLASGLLWPIPIVLDVNEELGRKLAPGMPLALRDPEGVLLAIIHVQEIWQPDRLAEAQAVYGMTQRDHPGVAYLLEKTNPYYAGGHVEGVELPSHYDFRSLRLTPAEVRAEFARLGWRRTVAFHTSEAMHRAQFEMTLRAAKEIGGNLLIHPVVGLSKPSEVDYYARVRCYQALMAYYPAGLAKLALLSLATRFAGAREALWNAIVGKNFGCSHVIVDSSLRVAFDGHKAELGIESMPCDSFKGLSEDDVRDLLSHGQDLPSSFTFPAVSDELRRAYPARSRQGFTVFFTGLSGAGKSTIAKALLAKLLEIGGRPVTLLDGDIVRKHLSSELGFSREHRDINIRRIGYVASEITKNGGIAICAPIAPYESVRREVREMTEPFGGFVLVYVNTPLEVCEQRDRKGLYAKARKGLIQHFTGISDPYEPPLQAEVVLNTTELTPEEAAQAVIQHLEGDGYIG